MAHFMEPRRSVVIRRRSTLDATLPEGHPARFLWEKLSAIDFAEIEARYRSTQSGPGRGPYHPRLIMALWIYGMMEGLETAAAIERACTRRDDFRWLAGGAHPSAQTLLNFLERAGDVLNAIGVEVVTAMHREGLIDLSRIIEDGTKLRANASPASFHNAAEIDVIVGRLRAQIDALEGAPPTEASRARVHALEGRLGRAQRAREELVERAARRSGETQPPEPGSPASQLASAASSDGHGSGEEQSAPPAALAVIQPGLAMRSRAQPTFGRGGFRPHPEHDSLMCPADQELRLIGTYPTSTGRGQHKLYGRTDCGECALKPRCTKQRGRRVKIQMTSRTEPSSGVTVASSDIVTPAEPEPKDEKDRHTEKKPGQERGPVASVTEPEALMMLATSHKRWEPSYNADIAVTPEQVIVHQFLHKRPTDFHSFAPALAAVLAIARPKDWIGDGHYGTQANLLLAAREGVALFAPSTSGSPKRTEKVESSNVSPREEPKVAASTPQRFQRGDFRLDPARDVLICPADHDLAFIGIYASAGRPYRLYRKVDCTSCALKTSCTEATGRAVKVPVPLDAANVDDGTASVEVLAQGAAALNTVLQARDERMKEGGDAMRRLRSSTVEPVNAQLKQHGLRRFHVHGLKRCAAVLVMACIGHNVMKWKSLREAQRAGRLAAA